ncbi:TetR/AcrR family transcriptional regulator [Paenibacillus sp. J22TS3]|uniref:TetR/AcrR family transcriptional regulator n=1 Tax=Paenibacillus sp. J22TS3 TaxID=2807192 RepID=UPI001B2BE587|nr:TetR/AcrR family transcriptional regulator [Paenibacillus sp. J22TS3]GIP22032.1 TetR family transcriptional regulator [Paenibacillus sp. J22TS3]
MTKGEQTRQFIIMKSAELFNQRGFAGSSLSDITLATGIKKGGLYRHFTSKDEIAVEAYNYASQVVGGKFAAAIEQETTAYDKLMAYFHVYKNVTNEPPFIGGCPMQNTAVECDDAHPLLRLKAQESSSATLKSIREIVQDGINSGEFRSDLDPDAVASFTLSLLEGSIMLSKLEGTNNHMQLNLANYSNYLKMFCLKDHPPA